MLIGNQTLRIVPVQVGDDPVCVAGAPFTVEWRWYYYLPGLLPWTLLLALLVLPKSNRCGQAWLILLPVAVVAGVWHLPVVSQLIAASTQQEFDTMCTAFALGLSVLFLTDSRLAAKFRGITVIVVWLAMLVMAAIAVFCNFVDFSMAKPYALAAGVFLTVALIAMLLAGRFCRRSCTGLRFSLLLIVCLWLTAIAAMLLFAVIMMGEQLARRPDHWMLLFVAPSIYGGMIYAALLPFLILAFRSPFYRRRFVLLICGRREECDEAEPVIESETPLPADPADEP